MPNQERIAELKVKWLQAFVIVADTGSASQSAKRMGIHQSSVSRYIQALHEWTGKQLTTRDAPDAYAPFALTQDGQEFLTLAKQILATLEAVAVPRKEKKAAPKAGRRKIAKTPEMEEDILAADREYRKKHPGLPADQPLNIRMGKKGLIVTLA